MNIKWNYCQNVGDFLGRPVDERWATFVHENYLALRRPSEVARAISDAEADWAEVESRRLRIYKAMS